MAQSFSVSDNQRFWEGNTASYQGEFVDWLETTPLETNFYVGQHA